MIGESAASSRGGGFVSIIDSVFGQRDCVSREAGNFGHSISRFPASDTFLSRSILPPYSDSPEPVVVISLAVARVGSLESRRQREDYLNRRFEDRNWSLEQLVARFDTISVEENDDTRHKIHKLIFGDLKGIALVSVHTNVQIEDVWTNEEYTKIFDKSTENEVEVVQHKNDKTTLYTDSSSRRYS